jgi:hypothetical protein
VADSLPNFNELWTAVGYKYVSTVFSIFAPVAFWKPRKVYPDPEIDPPPEARYRNMAENVRLFKLIALAPTPETWPTLQKAFETALPDALRRSTIVSVCENSPTVTSQAPEGIRQVRAEARARTVNRVKAAKAMPVLSCEGFSREDYVDRVHLSVEGGEKFAAVIADALRALGRKNGSAP